MASKQHASNLEAMASNLIAVASNLEAMASNLIISSGLPLKAKNQINIKESRTDGEETKGTSLWIHVTLDLATSVASSDV